MTEKRFTVDDSGYVVIDDNSEKAFMFDTIEDCYACCDLLNELHEENQQLKKDLKDCEKLKTKRLNKIRNHRAVIEDLGGSIRAYKGKLGQANDKIEKIREAMEDTGALTKRQLEEILNE